MLKKYAQEVCDATAAVIGYNVFITDTDGIIIGCSDPDRGLGTLHEASLRAIKTRMGYCEDENEAKKFLGTNPGITYPIEQAPGEVVGTIAITGNPEKVAPFALIVKQQAEIFLREKLLSEAIINQESTLQNLIYEISSFNFHHDDETLLIEKAQHFGFDSKCNYIALIVEISGSDLNRIKPDANDDCLKASENSAITIQARRNAILLKLRSIFSQGSDLVTPMSSSKFTIFRAIPFNQVQPDSYKFRQQLHCQCKRTLNMLANENLHAYIGIGSIATCITELSDSYREARQAISTGKNLYKLPSGIYSIDDLRVESLLIDSEYKHIIKFIRRELSPLLNYSDWPELFKTIIAWCNSGFNISRASTLLHIHRNTLDYRLRKIEDTCKISRIDFRTFLKLYLAIELNDLIKDENSH